MAASSLRPCDSGSCGPNGSGPAPDRIIFVVGGTGTGKSALANLIAGCPIDEQKFLEGDLGVGETTEVTSKTLKVNYGKKVFTYQIVDTIGIGDGKVSRQEILVRLAVLCQWAKNGIHQILFVTSGRFSKSQLEYWKIISNLIFQQDVVDYTTIVRTSCPRFQNTEWTKRDLDALCSGDDDVAKLFRQVRKNGRVLHIDNPGPDSGVEDFEELRSLARDRVLLHLIAHCGELYHPRQLDEINSRLDADTEHEALRQLEVAELKKKQAEVQKVAAELEAQATRMEEERQKMKTDMESELRKAKNAEIQALKSHLAALHEQLNSVKTDIKGKETTVDRKEKVAEGFFEAVKSAAAVIASPAGTFLLNKFFKK